MKAILVSKNQDMRIYEVWEPVPLELRIPLQVPDHVLWSSKYWARDQMMKGEFGDRRYHLVNVDTDIAFYEEF